MSVSYVYSRNLDWMTIPPLDQSLGAPNLNTVQFLINVNHARGQGQVEDGCGVPLQHEPEHGGSLGFVQEELEHCLLWNWCQDQDSRLEEE